MTYLSETGPSNTGLTFQRAEAASRRTDRRRPDQIVKRHSKLTPWRQGEQCPARRVIDEAAAAALGVSADTGRLAAPTRAGANNQQPACDHDSGPQESCLALYEPVDAGAPLARVAKRLNRANSRLNVVGERSERGGRLMRSEAAAMPTYPRRFHPAHRRLGTR